MSTPAVDPSELSLDCPVCGRNIYDYRAGQWVAETRILKFVGGRVLLKCKGCRHDVPVPWLQVVTPRGTTAAQEEGPRVEARSPGVRSAVRVARAWG